MVKAAVVKPAQAALPKRPPLSAGPIQPGSQMQVEEVVQTTQFSLDKARAELSRQNSVPIVRVESAESGSSQSGMEMEVVELNRR